MKKKLLIVFMCLACVMQVWGQDLTQQQIDDYVELEKKAEQGDANAQYRLGNSYEFGIWENKDYLKAVYWYTKSAEQGNQSSEWSLGRCYYYAYGVAQDYTEAVKWHTKAAKKGSTLAQNDLGLCYYNGQGIKQDYTEAVKWFTKAAEKDSKSAQYRLGICYNYGHGVKQDHSKAAKWYTKAAEKEHVEAQFNLGILYYNGQGVKQDYTKAIKWIIKAAEQGSLEAQYNLGVCYYDGYGVEQDYAEAVKWYTMAAEQGDDVSQYALGICYSNGYGVIKNHTEAVRWFTKSAEQNFNLAQQELENYRKESLKKEQLVVLFDDIQTVFDDENYNPKTAIDLINQYLSLASQTDENRGVLLNTIGLLYCNNEDLGNLSKTIQQLQIYNKQLSQPEWDTSIQQLIKNHTQIATKIAKNQPFEEKVIGDWISILHNAETGTPYYIANIGKNHRGDFTASSFKIKNESHYFKLIKKEKVKELNTSQEFHLDGNIKNIIAIFSTEKLNTGNAFAAEFTANFFNDLAVNLKNQVIATNKDFWSATTQEIGTEIGRKLAVGFASQLAVSKKELDVWTFNLYQDENSDWIGEIQEMKYTLYSNNPNQVYQSKMGQKRTAFTKVTEKMIFASEKGEAIYLGGATPYNDYENSELHTLNLKYKKNNKKKKEAIREYNARMYKKLGWNIY